MLKISLPYVLYDLASLSELILSMSQNALLRGRGQRKLIFRQRQACLKAGSDSLATPLVRFSSC